MDLSQLGDSQSRSEQPNNVGANEEAIKAERLRAAQHKYKEKKRREREAFCLENGIPFRTHKWRGKILGESEDEFRKRWYREYYQKNKQKRQLANKASRLKRKDYYKAKSKEWASKNKEKVEAYQIVWQREHKEHNAKRNSEYAKRNREKRTAQQCVYIRERRKRDPQYRLLFRLRSRMWDALKPQSAKKAARTLELLGCSGEFFKSYLESQFDSSMSWDNYGTYWQIDHISPLAAFDLTKPHQQKMAFHYCNCRPLSAVENNLKADRVLQLHELIDL
jgi:hypothetical protein